MFDESLEDAWRLRFGAGDAPECDLASRFLSHRSVRKYSSRAVPDALVEGLVGVAQSAATSSNLQLWSVVSVQEPGRRKEIAKLCADQSQVHEAPWFFCFLVDHYRLRRVAATVGEEAKGLDYNEFYTMAVIDAALAAERMVCAAESIGLGVCYIGALRNDVNAVASLLDLPEGVFGAFGLCIGYPADDAEAHIKPRLPQSAVWFKERYDRQASIGDYDERMAVFNEAEGRNPKVTWSMRSGRRVDEHHLTGREVLKEFLTGRGLDKR